jgi:nucleoid-associated protein YgaU
VLRPALDTPVAQATGVAGPGVQVTHEVRPGETLGQIAAQYYGNANNWQMIFEANRGTITDPNALTAGARLVIPRPEATPTRAP